MGKPTYGGLVLDIYYFFFYNLFNLEGWRYIIHLVYHLSFVYVSKFSRNKIVFLLLLSTSNSPFTIFFQRPN